MHVQVSRRGLGTGSDLTRIGILGGTFNPPHVGHLICAQEACAQLGLELVVLMPTGAPPHKEIESDPGREHRAALCDLAVAKDGRLAVSRLELDRPGPSYTVDTLRALHAAGEDELTFVVGGDMARSLPRWREPEELLALAWLGVGERAGARRDEIEAALEPLGSFDERVEFFEMPRVDVSSSLVRRRVAAGQPIRYLVPDEVARYIGANGLYRAVRSAPAAGMARS